MKYTDEDKIILDVLEALQDTIIEKSNGDISQDEIRVHGYYDSPDSISLMCKTGIVSTIGSTQEKINVEFYVNVNTSLLYVTIRKILRIVNSIKRINTIKFDITHLKLIEPPVVVREMLDKNFVRYRFAYELMFSRITAA